MNRSDYYRNICSLALAKREQYSITTEAIGLQRVRKIYRDEGIEIDSWQLGPRLKALYLVDPDPAVAIRSDLPDEPKLFALVHELKHHWADQELIKKGAFSCGDYNENELVEKAAEVFAAEFIYPEAEFATDFDQFRVGLSQIEPEHVVRFKRGPCRSKKVSFKFILKRLEWLAIVQRGQFAGVKFQKLEEQIFGLPIYKRPSFQAARRARRAS